MQDPHFSIVPISTLRKGDILVHGKSSTHPYGHIAVYLGNNQEASDHIQPLITGGTYGGTVVFRVLDQFALPTAKITLPQTYSAEQSSALEANQAIIGSTQAPAANTSGQTSLVQTNQTTISTARRAPYSSWQAWYVQTNQTTANTVQPAQSTVSSQTLPDETSEFTEVQSWLSDYGEGNSGWVSIAEALIMGLPRAVRTAQPNTISGNSHAAAVNDTSATASNATATAIAAPAGTPIAPSSDDNNATTAVATTTCAEGAPCRSSTALPADQQSAESQVNVITSSSAQTEALQNLPASSAPEVCGSQERKTVTQTVSHDQTEPVSAHAPAHERCRGTLARAIAPHRSRNTIAHFHNRNRGKCMSSERLSHNRSRIAWSHSANHPRIRMEQRRRTAAFASGNLQRQARHQTASAHAVHLARHAGHNQARLS